jgi:hypothetical protein
MIPILVGVLFLGLPVTGKASLQDLAVHVSVERIDWSDQSRDPLRLLRVWLRVRMENVGDERLILPRSVESPNRGRVSILSGSRSSYEFWGTELYGPTPATVFGSVPDSERFVLLGPGEAFETVTSTGLQVNFTDQEIPKTVLPGTAVSLQAFIELGPRKPLADKTIEALRERWRQIGKLTTGGLWSNAVRIEVPTD